MRECVCVCACVSQSSVIVYVAELLMPARILSFIPIFFFFILFTFFHAVMFAIIAQPSVPRKEFQIFEEKIKPNYIFPLSI